MFWWLDCIELIRTQLNDFEMFNGFKMTKRTLKTVLRVVLITYKTVSIKPWKNREDKSNISQFSYVDVVVTRKIMFLEVVTPPYINHYLIPYKISPKNLWDILRCENGNVNFWKFTKKWIATKM